MSRQTKSQFLKEPQIFQWVSEENLSPIEEAKNEIFIRIDFGSFLSGGSS